MSTNTTKLTAPAVRLINVVPVLLQALREIANADTVEWDDRSEFEEWAKSRTRTAIAKVTGGASHE